MEPQGETISWSVVTHDHRERSVDWYWTLGLVALVGAGVSVWFGNSLLAIILLLGAATIGYLVMRGPREHNVTLDVRGISLDGTLYPYRSIASFWVDESDYPRLFVTTTGALAPHFSVPLLEEWRAVKVRERLLRLAREEEQMPHFGEHLAELFGL